MEVLTIEHSAFQQLISKIDAMDEFIRKAKLEQQSSLDDSLLCFCLQFLPEFLFRNAIAGFACKIVSLLFVYRVDI